MSGSPTPWSVKTVESPASSEGLPRTIVYGQDGVPVCVVGGCSDKAAQFSDRAERIAADAPVLAAAHDLLFACEQQRDAIDMLFARLITLTRKHTPDDLFFPSTSGAPWNALVLGNAAIEKARKS